MLELIESAGVNHLHAVPTMLVAMLEHPRLAHTDLSSLKTVMSGGSPVPAVLVRRVRETFGCKFTITFGQTINGTLSAASGRSVDCPPCFADVYTLTVTARRTIEIRLNSTAFDAFLSLLTVNNVIITNDDDGGGLNFKLVEKLCQPHYSAGCGFHVTPDASIVSSMRER